jgi:predicted amidohydrolase
MRSLGEIGMRRAEMHSPTGSGGDLLRIAAIQMNSRDDKAENIRTALELIDRAAASGSRLVALPEIWTYLGNPVGNRANAEPIPGPVTDLLADRARRHRIFHHGGSFHQAESGNPRVLNTAVVFNPDGDLIARYSKIHMFDVVLEGVATYEESATVAPGDEIVTVDVDGFRVGLAICYDLRFPELFRILALRGADLIVLPAAFTMTTGKDHWEILIRARAIENGVYMMAPGQVGADGHGKWCYGRSTIVDPWGTPVATASDVETVIEATVDRTILERVRRQVPSLANRMPDRYVWPELHAGVR